MNISGVSGFSENDVLPRYPGYALGNVIEKARLDIPVLSHKILALQEQFLTIIKDHETRLALLSDSERDQAEQCLIHEKNADTEYIHKQIVEIKAILINAIENLPILPLREMLPIDSKRTVTRVEHRSDMFEQFHSLIIEDDTDLGSKIGVFASQLHSKDFTTPSLTSDTIMNIVSCVEQMLKSKLKVCLIGSAISLGRVRTMDPIIIRRTVSRELLANADKYCVFTESVLGGIFIGVGQSISEIHDDPPTKRDISKIEVFSFISHGAIPKIRGRDLWSVYMDWRETLVNDLYAGFPIGYKIRYLEDILMENRMIPAAESEDALAIEGSSLDGG